MLAKILAYNKSAVCRIVVPALHSVLYYSKQCPNSVATLCCSKKSSLRIVSPTSPKKVWFLYVGKIPDDLIFSPLLQNFMLFLHQKMSLLFFLSRSCYFFVELRWPVAQRSLFRPSFSFSTFQICGHDN